MLFTNAMYVGIDPTAGQRPFVYAALDDELRLLALGEGKLDEALAFMAGQREACAGICAPRRPNLSLLSRTEVRERFSPPPRPGRWVNFRLAEYLLRQRQISSPRTPGRVEDCPNWMRMGFTLHRRLEELGYKVFPAGNEEIRETGGEAGEPIDQKASSTAPLSPSRQCLEVYPHAAFTVLLGQAPFPKHTLEGRLQRQLILHDLKLRIPDPMRIFEEITRFKLLKGVLPLEDLYSPEELDALVAAYTAWLAANHPEQITCLGDPEEGLVVLPVGELKTHYTAPRPISESRTERVEF